MAVRHLRLPFGASRDGLLVDAVTKCLKRARRLDAKVIYIGESESRAARVRQLLLKRLPALPAGPWGNIDSVVARLGQNPVFDFELVNEVQEEALLRAQLLKRRKGPIGRALLREVLGAIRRVRVVCPPKDRERLLTELIAGHWKDTGLQRRLTIVHDAYRGLEHALKEQSLTSEDDLEWLIAKDSERSLGGVEFMIVDDVYRMGPAQQYWLRLAIEQLPNALLISRSSGEQFSYEECTRDAYALFDSIAATEFSGEASGAPETPSLFSADDALPSLRRKFALPANAREEATLAAQQVRRWLDAGVDPSDIAVGSVTHFQAEPLLRLLRDMAIPVRRLVPRSLTTFSGVAATLGLLRALRGGAEREALLSNLRHPVWAPLLDDHRGGVDRQLWLQRLAVASRELRIVGGERRLIETWCVPLLKRADELKGGVKHEHSKLQDIDEAILRSAVDLLTRLDVVCAARQVGEMGQALLELLGLTSQDRPEQQALIQATEQLIAVADPLGSAEQWWEDVLDDLREQKRMPPMPDVGISVGGLLDLRAIEAPYAIVIGLVDGELPFPDPENQLLPQRLWSPEALGEATAQVAKALVGDVDPMAIYRHLLRCITDGNSRAVVLSAPRNDGDQELAPSLPLLDYLAEHGVSYRQARVVAENQQARHALLGHMDLQHALADSFAEVPGQTNAELDQDVAPWLASAGLAARIERDRSNAAVVDSAYAGIVEREAVASAMRDRPLRASPSQLQSYATCGMQYYFSKFLRLSEMERPELGVEPSERGSLLHEVLEKFLLGIRADVQAAGKGQRLPLKAELNGWQRELFDTPLADLYAWQEIDKGTPESRLLEEFDAAIAKLGINAASWRAWVEQTRESLLHFEVDADNDTLETELSAFLRHELVAQRGYIRCFPWLLELGYGGKAGSVPALRFDRELGFAGNVELSGIVDRIDVVFEGSNPVGIVVRDYKSGNTKYGKKFAQGLDFQLLIYARVAQAAAPGYALAGFFYHKLIPAREVGRGDSVVPISTDAIALLPRFKALFGITGRRVALDTPEVWAGAVFNERLRHLEVGIRRGAFQPTVLLGEDACKYCSFRMACDARYGRQEVHAAAAHTLSELTGLYVGGELGADAKAGLASKGAKT